MHYKSRVCIGEGLYGKQGREGKKKREERRRRGETQRSGERRKRETRREVQKSSEEGRRGEEEKVGRGRPGQGPGPHTSLWLPVHLEDGRKVPKVKWRQGSGSL